MLVAGIQAAAIGLIDDLVFAGIDVGGSYKSPGEVAVDLGKKVVTAAVSVGVGAALNGVGKITRVFDDAGNVVSKTVEPGGISKLLAGKLGDGFGQVALDATLAGVQTLATSTASAAVNAVTYSAKDGFGYSYEAFAEGAKSGLASAAAALTTSFTAGALGQLNLGAKLEKVLGFNSGQIGEIQGFNSLVGGLAGAGVSYAMAGETTLNVLNLKDLTKGKLSSGLLELRLGGEDGASMSIGTGGTDISVGAIAGAMAGLGHLGKNMEIEEAAKRNEMANAATGLRGLYGFGDEIDKAELESILSGEIKLLAGIGAGKAQTVTAGGQTYVILNGVNEADTAEKKLALALVLSHEGRRDGVTDENNQAETRSAVWAHTEMAVRMLKDGATQKVMMGAINGDENLRRDLNAYATAKKNGDDTLFDRYVDSAYDSSEDNWLLFSYDDGRHVMMDDGKKDLKIVYMRATENDKGEAVGTQVLEMKGSTSVAQSLYRIMGKERAEELMKDAPPGDKLILENPGHPDYEEKIGEYLMKTYDSQYLTSSRYVDGYITANLNEDGTVDKFTVSSTLLRTPESWDSKLGFAVAVNPGNNKARDILTFTKKDLNRNVIDTMTLFDVQSVDVYNGMDHFNKEINRDQPYNAPFVDHEIQGNTIASNFSLEIKNLDNSHPMLIKNASTVAGYWIDKAGMYNGNSDGGGAWYLHWTGAGQTDGNRTSDGCIIPSIADVKRMEETLKLWGMGTGGHIYGTLIDPRAGVNGHRLQQYQ